MGDVGAVGEAVVVGRGGGGRWRWWRSWVEGRLSSFSRPAAGLVSSRCEIVSAGGSGKLVAPTLARVGSGSEMDGWRNGGGGCFFFSGAGVGGACWVGVCRVLLQKRAGRTNLSQRPAAAAAARGGIYPGRSRESNAAAALSPAAAERKKMWGPFFLIMFREPARGVAELLWAALTTALELGDCFMMNYLVTLPLEHRVLPIANFPFLGFAGCSWVCLIQRFHSQVQR
jgi:hypothetical protein